MSSNYCIIPECYIDSCLIEVLLLANRELTNHQKGNGTVVARMKNVFEDSFCIGIIDEDRRNLDYLQNFDLVNATEHLKLWKHRAKHQYIIQIRPVVERWIFRACDDAGLSVVDFELPGTFNEFLKVSKSVTSRHDQRFVRLFKELRKKDLIQLVQLQTWLEYLKLNQYESDINQLKNG